MPACYQLQNSRGERGKKIDSSRDRQKFFDFTLGKKEVIKGWEMCVMQMCRGQSVKVVVEPKHAYGTAGCPPVSTLYSFMRVLSSNIDTANRFADDPPQSVHGVRH
jgi:hypothetical protein